MLQRMVPTNDAVGFQMLFFEREVNGQTYVLVYRQLGIGADAASVTAEVEGARAGRFRPVWEGQLQQSIRCGRAWIGPHLLAGPKAVFHYLSELLAAEGLGEH